MLLNEHYPRTGHPCYNYLMDTKKRPYFLWDYDLTEKDVHRILATGTETDKIWLMSRIVSSAHFNDVWKFVSLPDLISWFPKLKMRKEVTNAWKYALNVWGYHV